MALTATAFSACGGPSVDSAAQDQLDPADDDQDISSNELSLNATSTLIAVGTTTQFQAVGGTAPYTYSLVIGAGNINSSTGLYTSSQAGTVTIRVTDANGDRAQKSITVFVASEEDDTEPCVYVSQKIQKTTGITEASIDLSRHASLQNYVITGLGVRLSNDNLVGIYAKVSKLLADGSIATTGSYAYTNGNMGTTGRGELYLELPAGYFVTGVGLAPTWDGQHTNAIKLYGSKIASDGSVSRTIECLLESSGGSCGTTVAVTGKPWLSRYVEFQGNSDQPLVAIGAAVTNARITSTSIGVANISLDTSAEGAACSR